jgi:hypothetical protein
MKMTFAEARAAYYERFDGGLLYYTAWTCPTNLMWS